MDAAYAGAAAIVPELRHLFDGVEHADSFVFNPHKWLLVNFDCSAYFVRDRETLLRTFQVTPEYLRTAADPEVVNFRDWGIQLGRRFRALKLWFVIRSYGVEGLRGLIRKHVELARDLAGRIEAEPGFELMAPVPFGLVCFRYRPSRAAPTTLAGRAQCRAARRGERDAAGASHPHPAGRQVRDPDGYWAAADRTGARPVGVRGTLVITGQAAELRRQAGRTLGGHCHPARAARVSESRDWR